MFLVYTRTRFCVLCKSIQRGAFMIPPHPHPTPLPVGRTFKGLFFLPFLCVLHVFRRRRGERPSDGRKRVETLVCPPVAELRGLKRSEGRGSYMAPAYATVWCLACGDAPPPLLAACPW